MADNPFVAFVQRYRYDPNGFVRDVLKCEPDEWQAQFLNWIAEDERRISIASGHGVGKSTAASWAMLWYMLTRYPVKVVVTAPTSSQLYDALFAELKHWVTMLPTALGALVETKTDRVELKADPAAAFISARTSRAEQPEALQGVHSEHVMLVADEASGVPEAVYEAAAGSMSGHHAVTILLGNPTKGSGFFYDTHHRLKGSWRTMAVSCLDSSRVSQAYVEDMKERYCEDSNAYRVRVLGKFPLRDDDTVIPLDLVEAAQTREIEMDPGAARVWGVDVARFGSDASALCKRQGNVVPASVQIWRGLDTMRLTGAVVAEYNAADQRPDEIIVDSVGIGAGVADRLRELGLPARALNVGESPAMKEAYYNLRAELWFKMRDWLAGRQCRMPADEDLVAELVTPRYKFTSSGRIQIESKQEMKKRGLPSPDGAEAFMLTFAADAVIAQQGNYVAGWNKPIRRNVPVV